MGRGARAAARKALQALVREAIEKREALTRAGLGLEADAAALYGQAAQAVWHELYAGPGKALDLLADSPAAAYVQPGVRAARDRVETVRKQFEADDFRHVASTFEALGHEVATLAMRGNGELDRDREAVRSAIAAIELDASEFPQGSDARRNLDTHLADAKAALQANRLADARTHLVAARLALKRALLGIDD